ncbi:hypothetical protein K435DRAFT_776898 [Dendrothele bispora CBS 962.96]|uniref:Uncharacterized protein n=1 Tax=Dendrothele bispora (strain CBS 962.96) TaxID=1314807 RepID=A0A4S8MB45_DENBC|nr:hypothetical protein K435DRAFT_776898 [Dendrothele bispora CBS 962.96]
MGQHHQAFIIARLIPHGSTTEKPYYRCIGAHHHSWCYGTLPLAATHRFLTLIKNEDNAEIIRDELRRAQYEYGRRWESPLMSKMPCPYTLLLLAQAWNMDLGSVEDAYATGVGLEYSTLDPDMGSFDEDSDDDMSIIDVTDPSNPAYCFVYEYGGEPIDMKGYIAKYYDMSDMQKLVESGEMEETIAVRAVKVVSALEGVRVLTSDALAEAWPDEYNVDNPSPETHSTESAELQKQKVPSLVDLTLSPAVDNALASSDIEQLEYLLMIPGKAELVKRYLMTKNPLPDSGTALLTNIITHEFESTSRVILDLSGYLYLSSDQVVYIVNALAETLPGHILSLKLSGNQNISTTTVVEVLKAFPQLLRLVLLNTSITNDQLLELVSTSPNLFFNLHDLVHPAFLYPIVSNDPRWLHRYAAPATLHPAYRHGLTFVSFDGRNNDITTDSVPFFNPEQLLKKLARPLSIMTQSEDPYFDHSYVGSGLGPILSLSAGTTVVDPSKTMKEGATDKSSLVSVDGGSDWYSRSVVSSPRAGSSDCFRGVGWIFILKFGTDIPSTRRYGFVKVDEDLLVREEKSEEDGKSLLLELVPGLYKIYDVKGFLKEIGKEGRPSPNEEVVAAFEQALGGPSFMELERFILISDEEFRELLSKF